MELSPKWKELEARYLGAAWSNTLMDLFLYSQSGNPVYPGVDNSLILRGLIEHQDPSSIKLVMALPTPYSHSGACGRALAVGPGLGPTLLLKNVATELLADTGEVLTDWTLDHWVKQGVCLLNLVPISGDRAGGGIPMYQKLYPYRKLVRNLVYELVQRGTPAFIGLGKDAQADLHNWGAAFRTVHAPHPSYLGVNGFIGSKVFSRTNKLLIELGHTPIKWGN